MEPLGTPHMLLVRRQWWHMLLHTSWVLLPTRSRLCVRRMERALVGSSAVGNANSSQMRFTNSSWRISGCETKSVGRCSTSDKGVGFSARLNKRIDPMLQARYAVGEPPRETWMPPVRSARAARGVKEVYCHVLMVELKEYEMSIVAPSDITLTPSTHRFFDDLVTALASQAAFSAGYYSHANGTIYRFLDDWSMSLGCLTGKEDASHLEIEVKPATILRHSHNFLGQLLLN
jgi:hypothetical protein